MYTATFSDGVVHPLTRRRASYLLRAARSRRGRIDRIARGVYFLADCNLTIRRT